MTILTASLKQPRSGPLASRAPSHADEELILRGHLARSDHHIRYSRRQISQQPIDGSFLAR